MRVYRLLSRLFPFAAALILPFACALPSFSSGNKLSESDNLASSILRTSKPVVVAIRKVKNLAGRYAEEGRDADNNMIGFWKPAYEIRLAEILVTELANTGNFTIVERENLYDVISEQGLQGVNPKTAVQKKNLLQANYIIIASLSDFVPNTAGQMSNKAGRVAFVTFANDREQIDTYIAFDLRVVDTSTGSIAYSRTVEGVSSSIKKSDTLGVNFNALYGIGQGSGTTVSEEATPTTRAIRGAMVNIVEYLNCHLYLKNECVSEFKAADLKRKESTKGTLNLF